MEKLIIHVLPNWIDIPLTTLLVIIVISFPTFIFAAAKNKFKLYIISHLITIISMSLAFMIACVVAIVGIMPDNHKSYTITKTNDIVTVNSHSNWIANSTYNIIAHKDGIYYLENSKRKDKVIKLSDEEFERITNQK